MTSSAALLEADSIGRRHPDGRRWLLESVSLQIRGGQRLAVTGASGSGKTLLLRALALLDPLDHGQVWWQGRVVRRDSIPAFRRQAVYLHQRPALLQGTVEAALRQPFWLKVYRQQQFEKDRIVGWLQQLGRDESFLINQVRDLSGGESQIAALLRAMQLDPLLLLLDEPTAALDAHTVQAAEELICRWIEESAGSRAIVWVSHDVEQARRIGSRLVRVQSGGLVEESPA